MNRNTTPPDTCSPWKPVIMKKAEPNCAAPIGLPQGRTPSSMISFDHSKACMPTKISPQVAVTSISVAAFTLSPR